MREANVNQSKRYNSVSPVQQRQRQARRRECSSATLTAVKGGQPVLISWIASKLLLTGMHDGPVKNAAFTERRQLETTGDAHGTGSMH
jgi:hypothetical protein